MSCQSLTGNCSYPVTKSEGYFGVVPASVRHTFFSIRYISQYLLVKFDSYLVNMILAIDSQYPTSLLKTDPLTLELLPLS